MLKIRQSLARLQARMDTDACVLCGQAARAGRICAQCRRLLPWNDNYCEQCGQPAIAVQPPGVTCAACQAMPPPFEKARAPLIYDFPVDAALKAIKFKRQLWFVPAFSELLLRGLNDEFPAVDALVPVPLHRWRQMRRGFNQAAELCGPIRRATGLPMITQVQRIRATSPQTGLNAAQRKGNLRNAFAVEGNLRCRHPLIVDDVVTTGETCIQLAAALIRAGASSVSVISVARAAGQHPRKAQQ